jgi:hypothetical protein
MSENVKAIAEAVKATAELVKPMVSVPCRILENLAAEPAKELGGLFADRVRARRIANAQHTAALAARKLEERALLDVDVPLGFLDSTLEHAGKTDEPELHELWAELIANGAAAEEQQHPAFMQTLASMDARDAAVFAASVQKSTHDGRAFRKRLYVQPDYVKDRLLALRVLEVRAGEVTIRVPRSTAPKDVAVRLEEVEKALDSPIRSSDDTFISAYGWQFAKAVGLHPAPEVGEELN